MIKPRQACLRQGRDIGHVGRTLGRAGEDRERARHVLRHGEPKLSNRTSAIEQVAVTPAGNI
jgi:hypothetical protein